MIAMTFVAFCSYLSFKAEEEEEKTPLPFPHLGCDQKAAMDTVGVLHKSFCLIPNKPHVSAARRSSFTDS